MSRIKGGITHSKRRHGILKHTKGYRWGRKSKMKVAKTAKMKAGQHAFVSRRTKKRDSRRLWQVRINAAIRATAGMSYSRFMAGLKKQGIALDRKVLAQLAVEFPKAFAAIAEIVKK